MDIKINVAGEELLARDEQFKTIREDWNEYEMASGVVVRVKTIVQKIARVVDHDGKQLRAADGDPRVVVRHQTQIVSSGGPEEDAEVH